MTEHPNPLGYQHAVTGVEHLTAGADPTPVEPGVWPTPGQYVHQWNSMTRAERLDEARQIIEFKQGLHDHLIHPRRWVFNGEIGPDDA